MARLFLFVVLVGCGFCSFPVAGQGLRTVVIDPGHGGKDPGAVWGTIYEKDIVLDVALRLGELIVERMPGVRVLYTRSTDVFVDVPKRVKVANDAKADFFLSVHVNATPAKEGPSGAMTLIIGENKEEGNLDMLALRENDVIKFEDDYANTYKEYLSGSSRMFILTGLMQQANIDKSVRFASTVQKHFKASTPMPDKGILRHYALVLWHATMPGVLVELGFINNTHDRQALTSDAGKQKMAEAMLAALREYGMAYAPAEVAVDVRPKPSSSRGPVYVVQIMSSTRRVAGSQFKGLRPVEKYDGKRYRYYVGGYATRAEVEGELSMVRALFPDAFITRVEL